MNRADAVAVIEQLHSGQARLYTDGDPAPVRAVLSADIAWHVPGTSPIAGSYRGLEEVVEYMLARRALADGTFRMHRLDVLTTKPLPSRFVTRKLRKAVRADARAELGG